MRDFWINIAAGVVLSVASWLVARLLLPFLRGWLHGAPELAGQWAFFDSEGPETPAAGTAQLSQAGDRITAVVTRSRSRKGQTVSRTFAYEGRVRDGALLLSFQEPSSHGFIAGNLVLKVSGDLKRLTGYTVYLDRDLGSVVAHPIWYRRA